MAEKDRSGGSDGGGGRASGARVTERSSSDSASGTTAKADRDSEPTREQQAALDGTGREPVYDRVAEEDLPPRERSGNLTTRELNDARAKAVADLAGGQPVGSVPAGSRPSESSDPVVHQILAELQDAQTNEDVPAQERLGRRLAGMGYDVG